MNFFRVCSMLFLISILTQTSTAHSIEEVRKKFQLAIESSTLTNTLSSELNKVSNPDPVLLAYIASLEALKAKHSWSPISKLQYMEAHKKVMNDAVRKSPNNLEIRYLRFNIQYSVPSYLGYSSNLEEDKKFIIQAFLNKKFDTTNKKLIQEVYNLMVQTKSVSAEEKLKMEKVLRSL
jgi:hypothetical protein